MSKNLLYLMAVLNAAACAFNVLDFVKTTSIVSFALAALTGYFLWTYLSRINSNVE